MPPEEPPSIRTAGNLECFGVRILLLIIVDIIGNLAIDIGFSGLTIVPWAVVKTVVDYLLERCLGAPMVPRVGGTSNSTHSWGRKVKRDIQGIEDSRIADQ